MKLADKNKISAVEDFKLSAKKYGYDME